MILAKFRGPVRDDEQLTKGRIYVLDNDVAGSDIVVADHAWLVDDAGNRHHIDLKSDLRFFRPKFIYAVALESISGANPGDTMQVSANKIVDGVPYVDVSHSTEPVPLVSMMLLDENVLQPDMQAMLLETGDWLTISEINPVTMRFKLDVWPRRVTPLAVRFAVVNGDILVRPIVTCVIAAGQSELTVGKHYEITRCLANGIWELACDTGEVKQFMHDRFRLGF